MDEDQEARSRLRPALAPGDVVAGRFRVVRRLGSGGMGDVYEVWDQDLGAAVALKTLRPDLVRDPTALDRFRREVQLTRQVTHRNVCRVYDFVHQRGVDVEGPRHEIMGLTMELLRGETLAEHLSRSGAFAPHEALPIVRQIATALAAAHRVGVVHRDLKCGNVMLEPPGDGEGQVRAVVTDFGLAYQQLQSISTSPPLTAANVVVGTADYMSPEQSQGKEATGASDIYALGVVMFEMLTGRRPHEAPTPMATLLRRLREPPPSPRELRPDLDLRWEVVIRRCLALEPHDRFTSPIEVIAALEGRSASQVTLVEEGLHTPATTQLPVVPQRPRMAARAVLLLGAVAGPALVYLALSHLARGPAAPRTPVTTQLSTWPGLEVDPVLSPDGRALAFSANRSGRFEIYLQQLAPGSREIQLTDDQSQSFQPSWSPDGAYLAYASHGRGGIWVIPSLGGTPRQLTTIGSHPAWSPDGRSLAFQSEPTAELSASAVPALPPSTLWVVAAQGGAPRQVTREGAPPGGHGSPRWSPDGQRLVFSASDRRGSAIWTVRPDGSDARLLADSPAFCLDPLVTSDGRRLLFAGIAAGERYAIWAMPVDREVRPTGAAAVIYSLPMASARQLDVSRDGTRLVHAAFGTSTNLWKLSIDPATGEPSEAARPLTSGSGRHSRPVFSHDGSLLAFDRRQVGSSQQVWIMAMDGSTPRQLTFGPAPGSTPSFLPGNEGVVFVSEQAGQLALWRVGPDGGTPQRMRELPPKADGLRLSSDGTWVVFHRAGDPGGVNLWLAKTAGGEPRQLTFDPELLGFGCFSPDDRWIAAERRRGDDDQLVVVPVEGGEPVGLSSGRGRYWPHSWSPDGRRIALAALRDGRWNLFWVATADRELRQLTFFDSLDGYVRYPAWSPRGDCIVFVRAETFGDLWMVENLP